MMRNIVAINVSPRKNGTSAILLDKLKIDLEERGDHVLTVHLYDHLQDMETIFDAVQATDTMIICGPCYVNSYPADTTRLLMELAAHPDILHGQNLYGVIQGGMPYAHTHASGLRMLKIFADKVNITYRGGFVMGLGALMDGQSLGVLPNGKKIERQFAIFGGFIHEGAESPDSVYESALLKLPGIVTRILAVIMNRRVDKSFAARGMDAHQPSPYLSDSIDLSIAHLGGIAK
ncbi:MAG: hypothetical protein LBH09_05220 [Peptococcaceae bacterium]|jgi:hypothetical protein|nr:hypothetical protein [Peptococcaceae bacterium]